MATIAKARVNKKDHPRQLTIWKQDLIFVLKQQKRKKGLAHLAIHITNLEYNKLTMKIV
jgi:hypothetical protein